MRRHSFFAIVLFLSISLLTTAALAATTATSPATPPAAPPSPDDPALVRELAERLLTPMFGPGSPQIVAKLYPGKLPPDLQVTLPSSARVVGSVTRTGTGAKFGGPGADVVLDMSGSTTDVLASLHASLVAAGWTAAPVPYGTPRGFQATVSPVSAPFCKAESWMNVSVSGGEEGVRDVRLSVNGGGGPCGVSPAPMQKQFPPGMDKLPALYAPKGVALTAYGAPGGPNRWGSEAVANTTLSARDLEGHFAAQLRSAGWSRTAGGADGPLAWSTWKVDATWTGFLSVLESASGTRELSVRVMSEAPVR